MRSFPNFLPLIVFGALAAPARATDAPHPAGPDEIARLVRALGAEDWAERERATARLMEIGKIAHPAVREALASEDAEVRYRARVVLRAALRKVVRLLDAIARDGASADDERFRDLVAMGADAVDPLVQVIGRELAEVESAEEDRVRTAFNALGKIRSPRAVGPLLSLLDLNLRSPFRERLAHALEQSGAEAALKGLAGCLGAELTLVRRNAVEVLGLFRGGEVVAALERALEDADAGVRAEAVAALEAAAGGRRREGPVVGLIVVGAPGERWGPLEERRDPPDAGAAAAARDAILKALDDADRSVQRRAIEALAGLGDRRVLPRLRAMVAAAGAEERAAARGPLDGPDVAARGPLDGPDHPERSARKRAESKDGPPDERMLAAVRALGALGDVEAVPLLLPLLESARPRLAATAIDALGALRSREAVPGLVALLAKEGGGKERVIRALGEIGDPAAFEPLAAHYRAPGTHGATVVEAVAKLPGPGPRAFLLDRARAAKNEVEVRLALEALEERGPDPEALGCDEAAVQAALAALERPSDGLKRVALEMIARMRFRPAFEEVARCLASTDRFVRIEAAQALGALEDERAVEPLRAARKKHADDESLSATIDIALARVGDAASREAAIRAGEARLKNGIRDPEELNQLGILYLYRKDWEAARKAFEEVFAANAGEGGAPGRRAIAAYNLACTHSLAGRTKEALEWLEKSVEGFHDWKHMEADPDLDPIRHAEGYRAVLDRMRRETERSRGRRTVVLQEFPGAVITLPEAPGAGGAIIEIDEAVEEIEPVVEEVAPPPEEDE